MTKRDDGRSGESRARAVRATAFGARVRVATLADAAAIAPLVLQLGYPTDADGMRARLGAILDRSDYVTLVAETKTGAEDNEHNEHHEQEHDNNKIVGLAGGQLCPSYSRDRPSGRVVTLVVDSESRGRGIGALLVRHLEDWLIAAGAGTVFVNSRRQRTAAHHFYERLGYECNGLRLVRALAAEGEARPCRSSTANN